MPGARQQVLDALTRTLLTSSAQKLRVGDLLREADINRSTFYYHFASLDDAYKELIEEGLAPIGGCLPLSRDVTDETFEQEYLEGQRGFFAYCKEHSSLYYALLWGDLRDRFLFAFIERMEFCLEENYRFRLSDDLPGKDEIDDAAYHMLFYRVAAYKQFSILETWASMNFEQAPEIVAEVACLLTVHNPDLCSPEVRRSSRTRR